MEKLIRGQRYKIDPYTTAIYTGTLNGLDRFKQLQELSGEETDGGYILAAGGILMFETGDHYEKA